MDPAGRPARKVFFGVRPPDSVVAYASAVIARMREPAGRDVAWVLPENLHVTVLYVGPVGPRVLDGLVALGGRVAATTSSFVATLGALDAFPNRSRPRVAVLDLQEPSGALAALHEALGAGARPMTPLESRPFRAHLTIARARAHREDVLRRRLDLMAGERFPGLAYPCSRLELLESRSGTGTSRYETIAAWSLRST